MLIADLIFIEYSLGNGFLLLENCFYFRLELFPRCRKNRQINKNDERKYLPKSDPKLTFK